jgi:hypothetical protein
MPLLASSLFGLFFFLDQLVRLLVFCAVEWLIYVCTCASTASVAVAACLNHTAVASVSFLYFHSHTLVINVVIFYWLQVNLKYEDDTLVDHKGLENCSKIMLQNLQIKGFYIWW